MPDLSQTIHTHTYPNGLVLLGEPMRSLESAAFTIRVPGGCIYEPESRGGLSVMTVEMTTRGAGQRDSRQFVDDLDNLGVERGDSVSDSLAGYSGATLSKNLIPALGIFADVVRRAHLPEDELDAARMVALQELAGVEDEPGQKVMQELRKLHYPWPWGRRSQGERAALESISLDEIQRHYTRCFRPNGTIISVAGKVDWPAVRDAVGDLLGDWKPIDVPAVVERPRTTRLNHLTHESNQTHIAVAYDSIPYSHPDYFQAWGAVGVLSGGMSSRLFAEVREKRGLCYTVYASQTTLKEHGAVLCYSGTTAERAQETLDVTVGELRRLADGIEEHELARLKARIKSGLIMQQESSSSRSASIVRDWYLLGRVRTLDEISKLVDDLSAASINDYLKRNPPRDFTIVTLGRQPLEVARAVSA
ncbi:MAG: insulinase family protein [Planctomycetaceae bacterium]|nr:insulinase family protein [Planctomycetaceae bacterium]